MITVLSAAAIAAVLSGCVRDIDYKFPDYSPKLVVNMLTNTSATEHTVQMALSYTDQVKPVRNGTVTCTVNGVKVASANAPEDIYGTFSTFRFNAAFKPGDKVRIDAMGDSYSAYSEIVVPQPPVIEKNDTIGHVKRKVDIFSTYEESVLLFNTRIRGVEGTSFYRLVPSLRTETYARYIEDEENPDKYIIVGPAVDEFNFDLTPDNDPVLDSGNATGDIMEMLFDTKEDVSLFSDKFFRGQPYTLRYTAPSTLESVGWFNIEPHEGKLEELEVVKFVVVSLESLSDEAYYYMKAASTYMDATLSMLFEPTSLPNNVKGGLGIVSVAARVSAEPIELSRDTIDCDGMVYYGEDEPYPSYGD